MNKTLIALAVSAAAVVATGANAAEVYNNDGTQLSIGGRAEARLSLIDGKAEDKSRARINVEGIQAITDDLYGIGFWEGEFYSNDETAKKNSSSLETRKLYAGLGGAFGEVTYGKNDGALGVITDFTDIMAYHGNSAADKLEAADRTSNLLAYKGKFDDLSIKASYRFADRTAPDAGSNGKYTDNGADGYSLSGIYAFGDTGFTVGAGYAKQNADESKFDAYEYMLAASYEFSDFYFAGLFTDGEKAKKDADYRGYELAAKYTYQQTVLSTTWNKAKTNDRTSDNNIAVDATYYFQPNFRGYISYNFNLIDKNDKIGTVGGFERATKAQAVDELALGLRYDF